MIVFAAIMPHPPISIPGVGSDQEMLAISKTLNAFEALRVGLEAADPDTIIIISPHANLEQFAFVINSESEPKGSLAQFGLDEVYEYKTNVEIADKIDYACLMNEVPCLLRSEFLDHGTLIPLYHLTKNIKPKIVQLAFSMMDYERHYRYGEIIQKVIESVGNETGIDNERVAIVASGDLSHRLTPNSPAGFSPEAQEFDHAVLRFLGSSDLTSLMNMEPEAVEAAAECGLRSIIILLGILHEKKYKFDLLSYEAPFGIGHMTARLL
ncbi:MAG: AmmeMemoRadiSam system protein B [Candidatus Moranbacteria bacterium]|nr:AmmeMemoRadiSam system protein B [Candidatus Moranbacteria bacterium]